MQSPFHSADLSLRKASRVITGMILGFSLLVGSTLTVGAKTGEFQKHIVEPIQARAQLATENKLREEDAYHARERNLVLRKKQLADERAEIEASKSAELAAEAKKAAQIARKKSVNKAPAQNTPSQPQQNTGYSLPPTQPFPSDSYKEAAAKSKAEYDARVAEMNAKYEANVAKTNADFEARRAENQAKFDAFKAEHGM